LDNLEDGYVRALALTLSDYGLDRWMSEYFPASVLPRRMSALENFVGDAQADAFRGEVWHMEAFVGAVARFNKADRNKSGDREVVSCWVASRGNIACTCVGSTTYEAGLQPNSATVPHARCAHASAFLGAVTTLAEVLGEPPRSLLMHFGECFHEPGARPAAAVSRAKALAGGKTTFQDEIEIYDTGGLPVAIVVSGTGVRRVPAPIKCARKATRCCYCDSSRSTSCSHVLQTRALRQTDATRRPTRAPARAGDNKPRYTSISQQQISAFNCKRSIQVDADVFDHGRRNKPYKIPSPTRCGKCGAPRGATEPKPAPEGTMLSHMGFSTMVVDGYKCNNCKVWVCADGREEGVVILSPTTAATASLVRHFCQEVAVEGDPFTKLFRSWWVLAKGRSAAGVMRSVTASRSRRTVSRLMSTGLALMNKAPPDWPFDCSACCDGERFRVVTADGIWVGYLKRLVANYYKAYSEECAPDKELLQVASLIGSEWVRRFLRLCLTHPEQAITVAVDQRKAASVALGILSPLAVPPSFLAGAAACTSPVSVRVQAMLSELWHLPTCSVNLAKGLLATTTKFIATAVAAQRPAAETAAELQMQLSLRQWLATPRPANRNGPAPNPAAAVLPAPAAAAVALPAAGGIGGGGGQVPPVVVPQVPFGAGLVPVLPTKAHDAWLPATRALPDNMAQGLLSLIVAIIVDPAVSPFKPKHVVPLRRLAAVLRSPSVAADTGALTSAAAAGVEAVVPPGVDASVVAVIREVTMLLGFLTSVCLLGVQLSAVAHGVADSLEDVCNTVEAYHAGRLPEVGSAAAFQGRWSGIGKTAAEMRAFFVSVFPHATEDPMLTGMFFPGRLQCRASAFATQERPETGTCAKNYQAARKSFTPGAFIICCACSHPRVLGFVILDQREGPPALLNAIITRFPVLPEYIVYDFGCGAVRSALSKLPWVLAASTITSDQFHIVNHVCSVAFDPRSFATLTKANTVAHEQRNRAIKLLGRVLRASGQGDYTRVLAYHMLIHNIRAHARSAAGGALPDVYDFGRFYFSREACLCGCGYVEADPFVEETVVPSSSEDEEEDPVMESSSASSSEDGESE